MRFLRIWHSTYGMGIILEEKENSVTIEFDNNDEKEISKEFFGKTVFLSEYDMDNSTDPYVEKRYKAFNVERQTAEYFSNIMAKQSQTELICEEKKTLETKMILPEFEGKLKRRIYLIEKRKYEDSDKKFKGYLCLIGIDMLTGLIVTIVDTNGAKLNLHTYNESFDKLSLYTVFEADFKFYKGNNSINVLRIVSDFTVIKEVELKHIDKEIKKYSNKSISCITDFNTMINFWENRKSGEGYALVNFTDTEIVRYGLHNQMKMGRKFVNVECAFFKRTITHRYYSGLALVKGYIDKNGNSCFIAKKFFSKTMNDEEHDRFLERKEKYKNQKDEFVEDEYSVFWSEFIEECKEKDETYIDYEGDIIGDYNEYETEEEPEENEVFVNDEY